MGRCLPDLKDQSGRQRLFSMTNTKAHEDVSCSAENSESETSPTSLDEGLTTLAEATNQDNSDDGSVAVAAEVCEDPEATELVSEFDCFGFSEPLLKTLAEKGYKQPSPIQKAAIPELMLGRDLVGQAQTGTGKTAAFALPLIERLQDHGSRPQVLVLAPTRELAMQVADSFRAYAVGHPHLKVLAVYGGADFRSQINTLKRGVDVVVGTPGRLMDHMRQGTLDTSGLRCLVLDEADEMLRMGFIDDVEWILEQLPDERQMVLFSATMPSEIRRLSKRYLREPAEITIKNRDQEARLIRHRCITLQNSHKLEALKRVLEAFTGEGVIIFARTKVITLTVAESLEAAGHDVAVLNGDVPQNQRERTVERLRKGSVNILVATDVAARGLDVDRISLVINYDIPFDSEAYVHRIGRTGRAGRSGEAILFVNPRERRFVGGFERAVGQPIEPMDIPNNAAINQSRLDRLRQRLTTAAKTERDNSEETALLQELIQRVVQELTLSPEQLALAALELAVGPGPILVQADEGWLQQSTQRSRRNDRHESSRGGSGRRPERSSRPPEEHMERFRVEVGHRDRVKPGNLVGAIANESGLEGRMIGRIQIFESHSLVDLPKGMPEDVFKDLKRLRVMNRELHIQRAS
ncbi:Cold-shock DEAD-box protein A [Prochlorococcus sp. MIT 0702]|uniref:DEAD/DEAH box helicase n=2 Tax=Prochlorococcus TaxID=1218 RepID=UPI000533AD92|nr:MULTISPECIES: DEAD/DEAH box helicase [unclassified Prochlorococcus]KGG25182.1 Cold-shock DEAD-box protein A [Prochlorococcus sp. MIT 0701]KGG30518.1 Cold-shock DEAD-box protein A [Prochlorococcus sp. MIT 0702]KGG30635.1 Cold-shock DEAD-box protein A [Prochlorococcus sp. MIT 0703]